MNWEMGGGVRREAASDYFLFNLAIMDTDAWVRVWYIIHDAYLIWDPTDIGDLKLPLNEQPYL